MYKIGPWVIDSPTVLAPMAGVTDAPFRRLCRQLGAGLAVSEMVTADSRLWSSRKSQQRLATLDSLHTNDSQPRSVQLAGSDPQMMAEAAQANVAMGAQIIDINMGCPAKKVCKKAAGSALLKDEVLVGRILSAVVNAVDVPVTLKIRTGWDSDNRNGVRIARIAEDTGIQALAVHGRTRACAFKSNVEYDTIAEIVHRLNIPVFANGDIISPKMAKTVSDYTGAAALMIGRGAQGNPWLFREINHFLTTGKTLAKPTRQEVIVTINDHLQALYDFYGEWLGTRIARKHVAWYLEHQPHLEYNPVNHTGNQHEIVAFADSNQQQFRNRFNRVESAQEQYNTLQLYFEQLATTEERAA
jgi:tRNA-dihydrouridine synthase B